MRIRKAYASRWCYRGSRAESTCYKPTYSIDDKGPGSCTDVCKRQEDRKGVCPEATNLHGHFLKVKLCQGAGTWPYQADMTEVFLGLLLLVLFLQDTGVEMGCTGSRYHRRMSEEGSSSSKGVSLHHLLCKGPKGAVE